MQNKCPLCDAVLKVAFGNQIHPGDRKFGINLYCDNKSCPSKEVAGHGKNEAAAMFVIEQKFKKNR